MALSLPLFAQDQQYPAWMLRRQFASILTAGVSRHLTDFLVTPGGGMQVSVSAGDAYVPQTIETLEPSGSDVGLYHIFNDGPMNPYNTVVPPTSYPRVDQVILRTYDIVEQVMSGASRAQIEWLQGAETPGADLTYAAPGVNGAAALPPNSIDLAFVLQTPGVWTITAPNIAQGTAQALSLPGFQPMTYVNTSPSTISAQPSDTIWANGQITVYLPRPKMGSEVTVVGTSVSGVSAATVVIGNYTGELIFGEGANGVSSFKLGVPGAKVTLRSDGVNWLIVSGCRDTGWNSMTLNTGNNAAAVAGQFVPASRLKGDIAYLRGQIKASSGTITAGTTLAQLASTVFPTIALLSLPTTIIGSPSTATELTISNTGVLSFSTSSIGSSTPLVLDGLSYSLS